VSKSTEAGVWGRSPRRGVEGGQRPPPEKIGGLVHGKYVFSLRKYVFCVLILGRTRQ
jgi:hypothetical protein